MKKIIDHLGRSVTYNYPPKSIVSIVPAITETLYHLSLDEQIVGRTRFCKFPADRVEQALNIGGTKEIKLDRIHSLKPDLIIAEKEENTKEIVETLEEHYPTFVFEIQSIDDSLRMVKDLGKLVGKHENALLLHNQIEQSIADLPALKNKRAAYMIWQNPHMVVGNDTYINSLLQRLGFSNPFVNFSGRYPMVTLDDLKNAQLDYLFLATEPFPFQEKHVTHFQNLLPDTKTTIIDGEMFWYGAKAATILPYFEEFLSEL